MWWNDLVVKVCFSLAMGEFVKTGGLNAHWTAKKLPYWIQKKILKKEEKQQKSITPHHKTV